MHYGLIVLFSLVSFVRNNDVSIGIEGGRKIFEDTRLAGPAIWRQIENVTVIAPDNEVISKVNITDLRPDKDGDVQIVDGGDGENSVTVELKSPTVLRGYEFHIEVYSIPTKTDSSNSQTDILDDLNKDSKTTAVPESSVESDEVIPVSIGKDSDMSRPARETNDALQAESETTEAVIDESTTEYMTTDSENDSTTEKSEGSGSEDSVPVDLESDLLRPARHATEVGSPLETTTEMEEFEIKGTLDYIPTTEETTSEMEEFEVKGTLDYIPTTEESASENNPVSIRKDIIRPARETNNENESDVTTEIAIDDESTETAEINNSEMDKSHYSNLDILEYIKRKEQGARQIRRIDEEEDSNESSSDESSESQDETVDLVPPEETATYSDNFSSESTETPTEYLETTLSSNPRFARRFEIDSSFYTTTETAETNMDGVTDESTMAEVTTESEVKSRNSRNSEILEDNQDLDLSNETSAEPNIPNDKISSGIVLLRGNEVIVSSDGKELQFNLPIVLIIGNENNFPLYNLIGSQDIEKKVFNTDSEIMNDNLDENVPDYPSVDAEVASEVIMNDDSY